MQQSVEANCHFEELSSADLLSTVQSLPESSGSFLINDPIGKGYEIFLRWAISDIQIAASASESDERDRYATNAIMSARRSLSCLVDQYLVRDGIAFCQDAPQDARAKAEVLIERGILDSLASDVLQKAITKRNQIEHDYSGISLEDAQNIVQVVRGTIDSITSKSSPYNGLCLLGNFLHGSFFGPSGAKSWFNGWSEAALMILRFDVEPWIGIIIPSSRTDAVVRRIRFGDITVCLLLDTLEVLESKCTSLSGGYSTNLWSDIARAASLLE